MDIMQAIALLRGSRSVSEIVPLVSIDFAANDWSPVHAEATSAPAPGERRSAGKLQSAAS